MMIKSKLDDLVREKEYHEKRRLSLKTISEETGLAIGTVQRMRKGDVERVYMSTLDTLCRYFGVEEIGALIQYVPDQAREMEAAA